MFWAPGVDFGALRIFVPKFDDEKWQSKSPIWQIKMQENKLSILHRKTPICAIIFKFIVLHLSLCLSLYSFAFVLSWNIYFVPWVKGISAAWRRKSFDKSTSRCWRWKYVSHPFKINSQSLEDTQVGYISQKYTLDKYTMERASEPSCMKCVYTFSSI